MYVDEHSIISLKQYLKVYVPGDQTSWQCCAGAVNTYSKTPTSSVELQHTEPPPINTSMGFNVVIKTLPNDYSDDP